jgi:imidazolonepropionase-like amidohydrolase
MSRTLLQGIDADLVALSDDPAQRTAAFSKVRCTIRGGEVIYASK